MSDRAPARSRATLVRIDPLGGPSASIPLQYNPDSLKRGLQPETVGGQSGGHSEAVRFTGAPAEVITFNAELEGYDDLPSQQQNIIAGSSGIFPLLYALETLIYPPSSQIRQAAQSLASGTLEIAPVLTPPLLLVLGSRVVPVMVQGMEVTEQAFDAQLNPLRATVAFTLRVVSYGDTVSTSPVFHQYLQYQSGKETLASKAQF